MELETDRPNGRELDEHMKWLKRPLLMLVSYGCCCGSLVFVLGI